MELSGELTSDQHLKQPPTEDVTEIAEQRPRRKSILKVNLSPETSVAVEQRRPSKRVSFADEEGKDLQSVLQLETPIKKEDQQPLRQSKCCTLW